MKYLTTLLLLVTLATADEYAQPDYYDYMPTYESQENRPHMTMDPNGDYHMGDYVMAPDGTYIGYEFKDLPDDYKVFKFFES